MIRTMAILAVLCMAVGVAFLVGLMHPAPGADVEVVNAVGWIFIAWGWVVLLLTGWTFNFNRRNG